jgi:hypothetical protein
MANLLFQVQTQFNLEKVLAHENWLSVTVHEPNTFIQFVAHELSFPWNPLLILGLKKKEEDSMWKRVCCFLRAANHMWLNKKKRRKSQNSYFHFISQYETSLMSQMVSF